MADPVPSPETNGSKTSGAAPPASPATAKETLSWIRALASQWEDERGRPEEPAGKDA